MTIAQPMVRRVAAAQATVDRFKDRPFRWGREDCARMVAFHLRKMGYSLRLAKAGSYTSALGAKRALRALGFADLAAAIDSYGLERIPPAAAVAGDILLVPGEDEFGGALHVAVGNGRSLAYHQDVEGAAIVQPVEFIAAWRVTPR